MLRHGQTEYNASGRMQGQMDTKLSDVGIRQAEAVARYMKGVNIGYVVSSDLSRAAETTRGRGPSGAITRCGHPPAANPASRWPGAPVT